MGSQKTMIIEEHRNNPCVVDIKQLIAELRKIKAEKDIACGHLILQLQEVQEELRQAGLPYDHQSEVIEATIKDLMQEVGHTIKTEYGAANWRNGSVRVTYDYKALDAIEDLHIQAAIQQYRKATEVSPSVSVEVY